MAHECPECWQVCHCGGDIDDLCFNDTEHAIQCSCCDDVEEDDCDDPYIKPQDTEGK